MHKCRRLMQLLLHFRTYFAASHAFWLILVKQAMCSNTEGCDQQYVDMDNIMSKLIWWIEMCWPLKYNNLIDILHALKLQTHSRSVKMSGNNICKLMTINTLVQGRLYRMICKCIALSEILLHLFKFLFPELSGTKYK